MKNTLQSNSLNEWKTGKWVVFSAMMASSMAFIDGTAINVAIPSLQHDLHASGEQLLWILNSYLIILSAFILFGGSLGDKLGRKKVFGIGIIVFMFGSIACGFSQDVKTLIAARLLQGMGGALMIPGSLSIISSYFSQKERGKAIGNWSAASMLVTTGGPMLGGFLADMGLWRYIFFINVPLGIISLVILYLKVPESRDDSGNNIIDYWGALLASLGLATITYGFISLPDKGISNPFIYGSLFIGFLSLFLFVIVEWKSKNPMMPLQLFQISSFSGANLLTLFLYAALSAVMFFLSLNLIQVQAYSQFHAGLSLLPFSIIMITFSKTAGGLIEKFGAKIPLTVGPLLTGFGFFLLGFTGLTNGISDYWSVYLPAIIVFSIGMTITVIPLTTTVMGSVENHFSGTASGINNAVSRAAGVLAIAVIGMVALTSFKNSIVKVNESVHLTSNQISLLKEESTKLGEASVPNSFPKEKKEIVKMNIKKAFINTFSLVMFISAALACLGSLVSFFMIEKRL